MAEVTSGQTGAYSVPRVLDKIEEAGRAIGVGATVGIDAAVALTGAEVQHRIRARRATCAWHVASTVRVAETLVIGAPHAACEGGACAATIRAAGAITVLEAWALWTVAGPKARCARASLLGTGRHVPAVVARYTRRTHNVGICTTIDRGAGAPTVSSNASHARDGAITLNTGSAAVLTAPLSP